MSRIRSRPLLAASLVLLASGAAWAQVLAHDGVGLDNAAAVRASLGSDATLRGTAQPYVPQAGPRWAPIQGHLANFTYVLDAGDPSVVLLATSAAPHSAGTAVVAGSVALRAPHPDGSARTVVVLAVRGWTTPILFR